MDVATKNGMAEPAAGFARTPFAATPHAVVMAVVPEPVVTPEMVMDWLAVRHPVQLPALPVMLMLIGEDVAIEANVLAPVA